MLHRSVLFVRNHLRSIGALLAFAMVATALLMPVTAANAQSIDITADDLQVLWDMVNLFLPIFLPILAIGGGIYIAVKLSQFVIRSVTGAFGGGS